MAPLANLAQGVSEKKMKRATTNQYMYVELYNDLIIHPSKFLGGQAIVQRGAEAPLTPLEINLDCLTNMLGM